MGDPAKVIPIRAEEGPRTVWMYEAAPKIYPRAIGGRWQRLRWLTVWLTQLVFYGLPWLEWGGRQAVLFDLAARRFYLFGLVLYPQDFIYLTGLLVLAAYGLFLFTAVAGRVWCGYACPQTVYTEMFLWLERITEGDRMARQKLDAAPWSLKKLWRKGAKQALWIALALWTGFTFVGYFTPIHTLWAEAFTLGFGPWEWFWVNFYALATYGNAGFLREQVCKYMCPYARFQSAMFDRDTMIVSYDETRGEPRGSRPRGTDAAARGQGDCIDCTLCVQVCPTGIDIRKGLQYECIGCAACIDACDGVMDKVGSPRGLIRYATQNALDRRWNVKRQLARVFRPRVLVYGTVMAVITAAFVTSLVLRQPFRFDLVRDRAALARMVGHGDIENVYRLQLMNSTERVQRYRVAVAGLEGAVLASEAEFDVGPAEARWWPVAVRLPAAAAQARGPGVHALRIEVERLADGEAPATHVTEKSTFVVPR